MWMKHWYLAADETSRVLFYHNFQGVLWTLPEYLKAMSLRDRGADEMDFLPFFSRYRNIAEKETRTIKVTGNDLGVPRGEYLLLENYCTDKSCDCRKVMINVVEVNPARRILATIGYGWESVAFYTKWMHGDEKIARSITGAYLELGGIQSQYAQHFLEIFKATLTDEYVDTLKNHYQMFKKTRHKTSPRL
jgi:hypothetical protein